MESLLSRLASARPVLLILAMLQKIPINFLKITVSVDHLRMHSQTVDRFFALLLWKFGLIEKFEIDLIKNNCRQGMRVIDIGANIGFHVMQMARIVGEKGQVMAFEPDPSNFKTLQHNLTANSYTFVNAIEAAVSNKTEKINLYQSEIHHGDHRIYKHSQGVGRFVLVQAYALDDIIVESQTVDLIKMDIQGAEGLALSGMSGVLERNPNVLVLMEFWPEGLLQTDCSPEKLLFNLEQKGFSIFKIRERKGVLEPIGDITSFIHGIPTKSYCNLLICRNPQSWNLSPYF